MRYSGCQAWTLATLGAETLCGERLRDPFASFEAQSQSMLFAIWTQRGQGAGERHWPQGKRDGYYSGMKCTYM